MNTCRPSCHSLSSDTAVSCGVCRRSLRDPTGTLGLPFARSVSAIALLILVSSCCRPKPDPPSPAPSATPSAAVEAGIDSAAKTSEPPFTWPAIAWTPDSHRFALGAATGIVVASTEGGPTRVLSSNNGRIQAIAFSGSGDRIATVNDAGNVHLWNASGAQIAELPRPNIESGSISNTAVAFSPEGVWIVAVTDRLRVWKTEGLAPVCSADPNFVGELRFLADSTTLLTTGGGLLKRLELATCKVLEEQMAETGGTFGSCLSPDGAWMAASEDTGHALSVFSTKPYRRIGKYAKSASCQDHVTPVRFTRDGQLLLATGNTLWFKSFRVGSFALLTSWRAPAGDPPESLVPFDDGYHLLLRPASGPTKLINAKAPGKGYSLEPQGASWFASSPDSKWFVGAAENKAFLWETETGRLVYEIAPPK